jgi:hypothetical protein
MFKRGDILNRLGSRYLERYKSILYSVYFIFLISETHYHQQDIVTDVCVSLFWRHRIKTFYIVHT